LLTLLLFGRACMVVSCANPACPVSFTGIRSGEEGQGGHGCPRLYIQSRLHVQYVWANTWHNKRYSFCFPHVPRNLRRAVNAGTIWSSNNTEVYVLLILSLSTNNMNLIKAPELPQFKPLWSEHDDYCDTQCCQDTLEVLQVIDESGLYYKRLKASVSYFVLTGIEVTHDWTFIHKIKSPIVHTVNT
jgi:hypothetical protein